MWTLTDALVLVRALQPDTRQFHYHLTLGGGVLNKGSSEKDLDLYFLPLQNKSAKPNPAALLKWLEDMWGDAEHIGAEYGDDDDDSTPYQWTSGDGTTWVSGTTTTNMMLVPKRKAYLYRLKFYRPSDRIDVFIS